MGIAAAEGGVTGGGTHAKVTLARMPCGGRVDNKHKKGARGVRGNRSNGSGLCRRITSNNQGEDDVTTYALLLVPTRDMEEELKRCHHI